MAAVYLEMKDYTKTIETCEKAIEVGRETRSSLDSIGKAFQRIGTTYFKQNDYPKAIEYYKKALIEHRDADTLNMLRKTEKLQEEKEKREYESPELSLKAKNEGNEFFKNGKYPEAVERYSEAIKRNPTDHVIYTNRATAYTKLGALPEAIKDCDTAIGLDKTYIKAYLKKGNAHTLMKEFQKALKTYYTALEFDPENKEVLDAITFTASKIEGEQQTPDTVKRNVENDPELQAILTDPVIQQVLKDMQSNPSSIKRYLADPKIRNSIDKLIAAGVISTR
eukprot:TRINITY_DN5106_c0_g1_i3.p1 TRINITY_DN5106_c0_g1~~TRINITY_DN5106_c0_g1_i3.p1  ORF type:complete len:280 (+),score=80.51 TRINITY_DN5106_c0_g1_i3:981-1820(+)